MTMRWERGALALILACGLFFAGGAVWAKQSVSIPSSLRQDIPIRVATGLNQATIDTALAMQRDGWRYIMPDPKSSQASWSNHDGRTTWWAGYWKNARTGVTSSMTPYWDEVQGQFIGDDDGERSWSTGGAPRYPNDYEWLLSSGGGPK